MAAANYHTQVYTMFIGYFGRPPAQAGLNYYADVLDKSGGNVNILIDDFFKSDESKALFAGQSPEQQVNQIFQNLFGRDALPAGLNYWTGKILAGEVALSQAAYTIATNAAPADIAIRDAKIASATAWVAGLDTSAEIITFSTDAGHASGRDFLSTVKTSTPADQAAVTAGLKTMVDAGNTTSGQTSVLTVGKDTLNGTSGNDTFKAGVVQNVNGEQTNELATGDSINGLGGTDTLNAIVQAASALNSGPTSGIAAKTVDVEVVNFTALDANETDAVALINAKFMNGLDKVGSVDSDVDLIVQNLNTLTDSGVYAERRNTEDLTIRFDHGGNDAAIDAPADLVALFDNDYLLSDSSSTTTLELRMVNNLTLKDGNKPLDSVESVSFAVGGVTVTTAITAEMQALTGTAAYNAVVTAIQAQLTTLGITDVTVSTLPERTTVFSDDVGSYLQGTLAGSYSPILVTSTGGALTKGQTNIDNTTVDFNGLNTQTTESSTAENMVAVDVELLKVGRGGEGGELVIGGMATDLANNWDYTDNALKEGVQVFNVLMDGDRTQFSSLAGLYSTNNTLDTVNVTWAEGSRADLIIGNQNTIDNRSVTADVAPNNAASTADDGFNTVTTVYNNALKDVRVFNAANNGVTAAVGNAAAVSTDVTLWATLSGEVVNKYLDRTDIGADPAADNANFAYTFGAGNDTLNLNISKDNLADSGTSGREDFKMAVATGAGNDTVVVQIGDGKASSTTPWYVNTTIQDNLSIATGAGNDTVHANGAGAWAINTGEGNDAIYSDNSGRQVIDSNGAAAGGQVESNAVWVFNSANQAQSGAGSVQNLFDLTSAAAATTVEKVANLDLTVSFRGINVTVEVGDTHSGTGGAVNDLVINQAIKNAINNNVYLSKLLNAQDGPGRTLIVTALTDGVFSDADISVSVANPKALSVAQTGANALYLSATQLTALGLTGGNAVAGGRFDSAIAEDTLAAAITGAVSTQPNENNIDAEMGNDTVVLSTSVLAKETVNVRTLGATAATDSDVVFNASAGTSITADEFDTIITSGGIKIAGGVGVVKVLTTGVQGSAGNDTINASTAIAGQTIEGLAGNDTITASTNGGVVIGGDGADIINLAPNASADTLVFNSLVGVDTVVGYTVANDSIQLSKAVYTALGAVGALSAADFVSGAGAVALDASDRIIYNTTTGALSYDADGNGAGASVLLATFTGIPALDAGEFTIVASNAVVAPPVVGPPVVVPPVNVVTVAPGATAVAPTAGADAFTLDVAALLADTDGTNTQATITGFSLAQDKLVLNLPQANAAVTTLAALNNEQGITVMDNPFGAGSVSINFGNDLSGGELVTLDLVGITPADWANVVVQVV